MTMELRQLTYFEAVVRHGGFTRAANALHVAQPAISTQVRRLEKELGVALLARTTRNVALTPAGEHFLSHVHTVLNELDSARIEMSSHAESTGGRVRIGATPVLGGLPLPEMLAGIRQTFPGVDLELRSGLIADLLERLARRDLDVVIGPKHDENPKFVSHTVASEEFTLITPPGFGREVTHLAEVADRPFVCLPQDSGMYDILHRYAAEVGFTPRITFETHSPASIRELVSAGMGVALLAISSATGRGHPIKVHRIRDAPPHPEIAVFRRSRQSDRAAKAIYEVISTGRIPQ